MRNALVLALLGEEKETLASLGSPGGNGVGNLRGLVGLEGADALDLNGVGAEPEELLGREEVPIIGG